MIKSISSAARNAWDASGKRIRRLLGREQDEETHEALEQAVEDAYPPVQPTAGFRDHLASNLSLAAHDRITNLAVEDPRSFSTPILLATMLALLAGGTLATWLIVRSASGRGRT